MAGLSRREFLKSASIITASTCLPRFASAAESKRKNIVLIMADDIGFECFGCYGSEMYDTPNIDRLAANGIRFTHCYSQPLCTPSRVKLMTGKSNIRNYVGFSLLDGSQETFAHLLKSAGYKTCVAGKWQLYGAEHYSEETRGKGTLPEDAGFDTHCLWQVDKLGGRYWGPLLHIDGANRQFPKDVYGPDVCCDHICDFIKNAGEKPFFAYYPMILVHNPFPVTPDSENPESSDKQKNFADMVTYMDKLVGRIINTVKDEGLEKDTVVMFVGDNGTNRSIESKLGSQTIRGGKGKTTDYGTRVPFISSTLGETGSQVCDDLVDFSDFFPTVAGLAGASMPSDVKIDGCSFLPRLTGGKANPREAIFMYYYPWPIKGWKPETRFARDKRFKLYGDGRLYDVEKDVLEKHPVLESSDTEETRAVRLKLQKVMDSMPDEPEMIRKK
ncbi:sulfatase-like hydrolase/transferase [Anaerohalosphaera lusitana]|nr:sulfatase-like hydrolase/transferase [Anaerohalosphaera lusitana]